VRGVCAHHYRRHKGKCKFADDRVSRKCRCSYWATGTFDGNPYRKSLKTRSFERTQQIVREMEDVKQKREAPKIVTIKHGLDAFLADCESRNLNKSTVSKYHLLRTLLIAMRTDGTFRTSATSTANTRSISGTPGRVRRAHYRNGLYGSAPSSTSVLKTTGSRRTRRIKIKPPQMRPIPTFPSRTGRAPRYRQNGFQVRSLFPHPAPFGAPHC
jgi:hypothetical protein